MTYDLCYLYQSQDALCRSVYELEEKRGHADLRGCPLLNLSTSLKPDRLVLRRPSFLNSSFGQNLPHLGFAVILVRNTSSKVTVSKGRNGGGLCYSELDSFWRPTSYATEQAWHKLGRVSLSPSAAPAVLCDCPAGRHGDGSYCKLCPRGSYCTEACLLASCPAPLTSSQGARSVHDCHWPWVAMLCVLLVPCILFIVYLMSVRFRGRCWKHRRRT